MVGVGEQVPQLDLTDDHGRTWSLAADRDRPLLLVFHRHFY